MSPCLASLYVDFIVYPHAFNTYSENLKAKSPSLQPVVSGTLLQNIFVLSVEMMLHVHTLNMLLVLDS